mgnify:FL=1
MERNRYLQICRENEYAALYYNNKEGKIIRYRTEKSFSFSLKYQLCILVTLYLGYLLNAKVYTALTQNIFLKHLIIFLCFVIGCVGLLFFENQIAKNIKNKGTEVPYILSDEWMLKGQKDLKMQKRIMVLWILISLVILLIFYRTNLMIVLVLFLVSVIALSAMAAATRPILRAKLYQRLERESDCL